MRDNIFFRIVAFFFLPFMFFALAIYIAGVRGPIQLDDTYMSLMRRAVFIQNGWNIQIPNIPLLLENNSFGNAWDDVINFLVRFANIFISFSNWFITFINFIVKIFTFIAALIKILWDYRNFDYSTVGPLTWWTRLQCL